MGMFNNFAKKGIGNFDREDYWGAAKKYNNGVAPYKRFTHGAEHLRRQDRTCKVRFVC